MYHQPFCCKLKSKNYEWKAGAGLEEFSMCMRTPHDTGNLKGSWKDQSGNVDFDYDCP